MKGLLLLNLGTPLHADLKHVRQYLKEFLMDKRVIDLPYWLRFLLVYGYILPFRAPKTQKAYAAIWTAEGSPLRVYSLALEAAVGKALGTDYTVALGMRYGKPSIASALAKLKHCASIQILALFPQYASASSGSALEKTLSLLSKNKQVKNLQIIREFYQEPAYIKAYANHIQKQLQHYMCSRPAGEQNHYFVLSYHGLPERQNNLNAEPYLNYKSQCEETSRLLAETLGINTDHYLTCFQSRLGRLPWIKPYTDEVLPALRAKGIQHIAIACPSFVCDCLETLEEINIRARKQWETLGGKSFVFIPALNADPAWISAMLRH